MNTVIRRQAFVPVVLFAATLACGVPCARGEIDLFKSKEKAKESAADATTQRLKEIEQATNGFADRYVTYLSDSCDKAAKGNPDAEARKQALRLKLHTSTSVYDIAASPNPLGQLLDLCVVVTLEKINWVEEGRARKVFGADHCKEVEDTFKNAYDEIWDLAARFLKPEEISGTKRLIRQWSVKHPDIDLLAYVRFDDFAKARAGLEQEDPVVKGLFSQLAEANHSLQSAQDFAERALYYSERMPRLLQWQTERTVQAVLENPDIQHTLSSAWQISDTIAAETKKFDERQQEIQKTLEQVNQITANGRKLMVEARQTSETLTETIKAANQLMLTLNPPPQPGAPPPAPGKPFDINEYGLALEKLGISARETRQLVDSAGQLESSPAFDSRLAAIEELTRRRSNHVAWLIAELIAFFFVMLLLTRLVCAKCLPGKSSGK